MAKTFLTNINLKGNQLIGALIQPANSAPTAYGAGQVYYNTSTNALYFSTASGNSSWQQLAAGTTSVASFNSQTGAVTLAGTSNQITVTTNSGTVTLSFPTNVTFTGKTTFSASTTGAAAINIPSGQDVSIPSSGDLWFTSGNIKFNNGSANKTVAYTDSSITGNAATADKVNHALTIGTGLSGTSFDGSASTTIAIDSSVVTLLGTQTLSNKTLGTNLNANSNLITNLGTPVNVSDAATKGYVDSTSQGLDVKDSVRVATVASGNLATDFVAGATIDGLTLVAGDRILIKNQGTASQNGIYTVNASGAPTRATDADTSAKVTAGMFTFVSEGTTLGNSGWVLTTDDVITLGSTGLTFTQFSGAGTYLAGTALGLSGNTFNVAYDATKGITVSSNQIKINAGNGLTFDGGTGALVANLGTGLVISGGAIAQDTAAGYGVRKYVGTITGDNSATSFSFTHGFNTRDITVRVYQTSATPDTQYADVEVDVTRTSANAISVAFAAAPAGTTTYNVVIVG